MGVAYRKIRQSKEESTTGCFRSGGRAHDIAAAKAHDAGMMVDGDARESAARCQPVPGAQRQ
eukprot:4172301-Prymnesium_polylepis.1